MEKNISNGLILLKAPKSLCNSLFREAKVEGVNIHQLILVKVCVSLQDMIKGREELKGGKND
jgi:hypothetical protein